MCACRSKCTYWMGATAPQCCELFVNYFAVYLTGSSSASGDFFEDRLAVGTHLSEALAAEHGTVGLGLEGHLGLAAAACAGSSEELTGTTGVVLASITAGLAALGLVLEAALCVELLLTGSENEFVAALFAN